MRSRRPPFALWPLVPSITGRTFVEVGLGRRAMLPPAPRLADRGVGGGKWGAPLRGRREARFVVASHATWQSGRGGVALAELVLPAAPRASFASRFTIRRRRMRQRRASSTKEGGQALGFGQQSSPTPAEGAQGRPNASEIIRSRPPRSPGVARSCPQARAPCPSLPSVG